MRRTISALVASTALLAAVAAPAPSQAAEATCLGEQATNPGSLSGTRGDDVIIGTLGADRISSGGGNDTICGEPDGSTTSRGDTIDAGQGSDFVLGFYGDDSLDGARGPTSSSVATSRASPATRAPSSTTGTTTLKAARAATRSRA